MRKALILLALSGCASDAKPPARAERSLTLLGMNAQGYLEFRRSPDGMVVILVPKGVYPRRPYERTETTGASEPVLLGDYLIDRCEVSNAQFARFLNETGKDEVARETPMGLRKTALGWAPQEGYADHPAVGVTGWGARQYAQWVGGFLPDPDQWMKAAGGPQGWIYPFGNEWRPDGCAWYGNGARGTASVDSGAPSPVGCLNMAGNVYERVEARGLPTMLKGGGWVTNHPLNLRVQDMCGQGMDAADQSVGFRCVMTVLPPVLRSAPDFQEGIEEARRRNVPVLLSLQYDTCGQCDRTRTQLFADPLFASYVSAHAVFLAGHAPGDAGEHPHPPGPDGACPLYPGLTCGQHEAIFSSGLSVVRTFRMSPGIFILDPRCEAGDPPEKWILFGEADLPKGGFGAETYVARLKAAQAKLEP